jgi:hypothetical protein
VLSEYRAEERAAAATKERVMSEYRALVFGPVARAFARAERGELCAQHAPPAEKLSALEGELKRCLREFGLGEKYVAAWSLCDTHIWEVRAADRSDSPVLATLNCTPGYCAAATRADGDADSVPCRWTQTYVPTITATLLLHGRWPAHVTPLVTDFRCICPVLVARSLGEPSDRAPARFLSCGDFAEQESLPSDRRLYGQFTRIEHESTNAWLRIAHARPSAALARAAYDSRVFEQGGRCRELAAADANDDDGMPYYAACGVGYIGIRATHPGHDA